MAGFKYLIKKLLPFKALARRDNPALPFAGTYYAQEGEDIILERIFEGKETGFYIDIGAHHPFRFSNTYKSYLKGWRGINIDATPGSMDAFKKHRPQDINLEVGISANETEAEYFIMSDPALNTFSRERIEYLTAKTPFKLVKSVIVKTRTLKQVLKEFLPAGQAVDFLTVDVEGLDFEILQTNDWTKYRPSIILIEDWVNTLDDISNAALCKLLNLVGYKLYAKTINTFFFQDKGKR